MKRRAIPTPDFPADDDPPPAAADTSGQVEPGDAVEPDDPRVDPRGLVILARLGAMRGLDLVTEYLRGCRGEPIPAPRVEPPTVSYLDGLQPPRYVGEQ